MMEETEKAKLSVMGVVMVMAMVLWRAERMRQLQAPVSLSLKWHLAVWRPEMRNRLFGRSQALRVNRPSV
ncbi:hypothetical protein [Paenibacillus sp. NPDC058174]|uniref:hypothetical protein n=1 Tax=Paenibacillus sp. NPDC058174 TaxID=3346366 RepID=UPI0036D7E826